MALNPDLTYTLAASVDAGDALDLLDVFNWFARKGIPVDPVDRIAAESELALVEQVDAGMVTEHGEKGVLIHTDQLNVSVPEWLVIGVLPKGGE